MTNRDAAPVIVIAGPTASGKSALALEVAEAFGGVILNGDSMQVYRGLEILTAQPSAGDEGRVPHRLFGIREPDDPCSAAQWRAAALAEIARAHEAGRLPLVVGGTGLYLRALRHGLAPVPAVEPEVRRAVTARLEALGGIAFRAELARRDPAAAARIPAGDRQRLIRAAEVVEATGRPLSDWQAQADVGSASGLRLFEVALIPDRQALYEACNRRFEAMLGAGALEEARALVARGLAPDLPAMKAVGVAELTAHVRGDIGLEEAVSRAQRSTRRLAKRQMTWIRHQMADAWAVSPPRPGKFSETFLANIFKKIRQFMLTG